jgi:hypothetical protein
MSSILVGIYKPDSSLRTIYQVDNGLSSNCKCISCDDDLVARQGAKVRHHFAHNTKNKESFACRESALHLLAKKVLSEVGAGFLPIHEFERTMIDVGRPGVAMLERLTGLGQKFEIEGMEFDFKIEKLRPDIVFDLKVYGSTVSVAFEIFSNKSFLRKRKDRVVRNDMSVVEICMDDFDIEDYTLDDLIMHFRNTKNYAWVWINEELRAIAEANWNEKNLLPAYSEETIENFVSDLDKYSKGNTFRFPLHEYMGKEIAYLDLQGKKQVVSTMIFPAFEKEYTVSGLEFDEWKLIISLSYKESSVKFPVLLKYFEKEPVTTSKSFLISNSSVFPSAESFFKNLEWGDNQKLEAMYRDAELKKVDILLKMYLDELKLLMNDVFSESKYIDNVITTYVPLFDKDCGIYFDLNDAKLIFGVNHLAFQDMFLKSLVRRQYLNVDETLGLYAASQLRVSTKDDSWIGRFSLIKNSYEHNKTSLQRVDDAINKIQNYIDILSPRSFLESYLNKCLDLAVLIRMNDRYQVLMGYEDIVHIVSTHGAWTLAKKR